MCVSVRKNKASTESQEQWGSLKRFEPCILKSSKRTFGDGNTNGHVGKCQGKNLKKINTQRQRHLVKILKTTTKLKKKNKKKAEKTPIFTQVLLI